MSALDRADDMTDEELLDLARSTSPEAPRAASVLFGRYRQRVYIWCYRYVREHETATDLAQDVLLRAYRSLDRFEGRAKFSSWLFTIARNRCINAVRPVSLVRDEEVDPDALVASTPGPDTAVAEAEVESRLRVLIDEVLDETERAALWLRTSERVPVDEITAILHIDTASGARGVLQAARRKLRAALEGRDDG